MRTLMKNTKLKNLLKKLALIAIGIYVVCTFFNQQQTLNAYHSDEQRYIEQIQIEQEKKAELEQTKANINSEEFIEEIARDKLNMYLPNEKVYIDINK